MLIPKRIGPVKKAILIIVLMLILGVILYLLYDSFFSGNAEEELSGSIMEIKKLDLPAIDTEISMDFFGSNIYTSLRQYGELPVEPDLVGRRNPFLELPFALLEAEEL